MISDYPFWTLQYMRSRPEGENLIQSWFDIVSYPHYFWNCIQINGKYQNLISLIRSKKGKLDRVLPSERKSHYIHAIKDFSIR